MTIKQILESIDIEPINEITDTQRKFLDNWDSLSDEINKLEDLDKDYDKAQINATQKKIKEIWKRLDSTIRRII